MTNTKIAYWLHDRAAEMIDGDDDALPDALRALVKRLLLEEKAAAAEPAERKPVAGWAREGSGRGRRLVTPQFIAWAFDDGTWWIAGEGMKPQSAASLEAAAALAAASAPVLSLDAAREAERLYEEHMEELAGGLVRAPGEAREALRALLDGPIVARPVDTADGPRWDLRGACRSVCVTSGEWTDMWSAVA